VFLTCWLVYSFFWTPYIVREHFPALALAERGSLNVERYTGWTDDIFPGPKGGAFINNNPGASLTGAIPLVLLHPLLTRLDEWNRTLPRPVRQADDGEVFWRTLSEGRGFYYLLVGFLTVALAMAPITAGTAAFLCARLIEAGVPCVAAAQAALLCGLGTPILFRTAHLNHNLLVGDAGFTALLLLWDPKDRPLGWLRAVLAGLLAGYAVLCDYSGIVVVVVIGLYVLLRCAKAPERARLRIAGSYAAGLVPGVMGLALYQAWAFGSFYHPSQHYMTPTAPTSHGYRGFDWPSPALAWENFFDPRFGLFAYCPALLLAFLAPFRRGGRFRIPPRETVVIVVYFGAFVLFCAANQYSWLQPLTGFRYLVPVVPGLALLAVQAAQGLRPVVKRIVAVATLAQSLLMAASHENDVRLAAAAIWHRHFALVWMLRAARAGAPVTPWWTLAAFLFLTIATALIWLAPSPGWRGIRRVKLATECETSTAGSID
jgi:hypothetical protein